VIGEEDQVGGASGAPVTCGESKAGRVFFPATTRSEIMREMGEASETDSQGREKRDEAQNWQASLSLAVTLSLSHSSSLSPTSLTVLFVPPRLPSL